MLSKWHNAISSKCVVCNEIDTNYHLIFACSRVNEIWCSVSNIMKININWSHIVLGCREENENCINKCRNNIITIIAYAIYASWVKCEDSKDSYKNVNIRLKVNMYLTFYLKVYKNIIVNQKWLKLFENTVNDIINLI